MKEKMKRMSQLLLSRPVPFELALQHLSNYPKLSSFRLHEKEEVNSLRVQQPKCPPC